ncbi:MAG TPA: MFS transporter [Dehalococcoidia bacterium]|jgi:MFS family permease|nr:MFS transporter [Dehalococcoidia bacterium]
MVREAESTGAARAAEAAPLSGQIAARVDRLPLTRVQWELAILTQIAWGIIVLNTDGIAARLYPFVWKPHHVVSTFEYGVIQALAVGLGILLGDFSMGLVADRYGRRPAIILSAILAGLFIWPFAWLTNFWGLAVVSILSTLGVGAILATHSVYIAEVVSPEVRNRVLLAAQSTTALIGVVGGLMAYYWIPGQYQFYVYVMGASQLLILLPLLLWRLPESPRWLEARGRHAEAERVMAKLEQRTAGAYGKPLPEPDPRPHPVIMGGHFLAGLRELLLNAEYRERTILLLVVWVLGYAGIIYGIGAFALVYLVDHGGSAHFVFLLAIIAGLVNFVAFQVNAQLRERFERRHVVMVLSLVFIVPWIVMYFETKLSILAVGYVVAAIGAALWLFNMYNYTTIAFPTRLRSAGMGTCDGVGHLGAWLGVTLTGTLYTIGPNHLAWLLFCLVPGALLPSLLIWARGVNQRSAVLELVST